MDRAVRLAIGGNIVEPNGQKLPLPAGVRPNAFEKRIESSRRADELRGQVGGRRGGNGGSAPAGRGFVKDRRASSWMPVRRGQYAVIVGGRPVMKHDRAAGADRSALMDFDHLEQVKALADAPMRRRQRQRAAAWAPLAAGRGVVAALAEVFATGEPARLGELGKNGDPNDPINVERDGRAN